jgi:Ca-activated chloride channel family protein
MQRRTLSLGLLAAALAACQSAPPAATHSAKNAAAEVPRAEPQAVHEQATLDQVQVTGTRLARMDEAARTRTETHAPAAPPAPPAQLALRTAVTYAPALPPPARPGVATDGETYRQHVDNPVQRASETPVSTFSIDVDTGSYSNVRRMLRQGQRPPPAAVRAEEFINYFSYGHPAPTAPGTPFRVTTELAAAPWNAQRQLLMIGIKGYDVPKATLPPSNLVFLIDTSGSMDSPDKLPLLKQALSLLVPQLRAQDRVSIVVYAGSAGLVLPPTPGDRHGEILAALDRLQAGGSTNGGDGIRLAYAMARQAHLADGVNRVILATDGDFNVGTTSVEALETLVADQRRSGVALTTLGFGQGNYNDAMAERLADVGDGNHAYIDTLQEARKVLVEEMQSTLMTIARDVKVQVEFNPALVAEYRLVGYENRVLRQEDFANDRVDAGDIGAGHEVTALYEITLAGSPATRLPALRYAGPAPVKSARGGELAHLRLRYKRPGSDASALVETPIPASSLTARPSESFRFATAVAAYADLLRGGTQLEGWQWNDVARAAEAARGEDRFGLRGEFVELVREGQRLVGGTPAAATIASD